VDESGIGVWGLAFDLVRLRKNEDTRTIWRRDLKIFISLSIDDCSIRCQHMGKLSRRDVIRERIYRRRMAYLVDHVPLVSMRTASGRWSGNGLVWFISLGSMEPGRRGTHCSDRRDKTRYIFQEARHIDDGDG
jgi:hypothetical protein